MIEAKQLTKIFRSGRRAPVRAVQELSFHCRAGSVFGLLGMNGAGKTTTLRMLSTILGPTSGTAIVCGHDVRQAGDRVRRSIGYLSGDTRLYDRLKVREILHYFGRLQGMGGADAARRAAELIERFELGTLAGRRVGKLSTGQKQRVNLARALVHDPPVLILDEPTAGLDVMGSREVGQLILEVRNEGRCVVLSTHIMREAEKLCDQIAIIHDGRILLEGTPAQLTTHGRDLEDVFAATVGAGGAAGDAGGDVAGDAVGGAGADAGGDAGGIAAGTSRTEDEHAH